MKTIARDMGTRLCAVAALCFTVFPAQAVLLVAPNSNVETLGIFAAGIPFGFDLQLCRFQQAYDSSQFSLLGANGGLINKILFRLHGYPGGLPTGVIHFPLTINLSTTSNSVNNLSTVFDQNTGPDKTTVYASTFNFSSLTGLGVVEPFGMVIPLSTPFFYSPTNGALLVEIVVGLTDEYSTGFADMDAVAGGGNGVGSVGHVNNVPNDTTMPTNGSPTTCLVTQFDISTVSPNLPILAISPLSATNVLLTITNGPPGTLYSVLTSTNLTSSSANWVSISDNAFGQNGVIHLTNAIGTNASQRLYRLRIK